VALQNATHQVCTGYGDSEAFYGGQHWMMPMHGVGQGNGACPAIWAVVSTPLLNMLRAHNLGCQFRSPISMRLCSFVGYTFVDDTDLIQSFPSISTADAITGLQKAIDVWEGRLKATGGALVPEKTFWYLTAFKWQGGKWSYQSVAEAPCVNDIKGQRKLLRRFEPSHAEVTLGVALAPEGNTLKQATNMKIAAIKWADAMRTGPKSKNDAWLAFQSTIWRTLAYPLPAINLTKEQCDHIMAPILHYILPAIGVCRNFPRSMVFTPNKFFGLGLPHLYTIQEISRLKDMMSHTFKNTTTGNLYRTSMELLIIELGMGTDFSITPYHLFSCLVTQSLVKSSWKFLYEERIQLKHDIDMKLPRSGDCLLMQLFHRYVSNADDLMSLNKCRLYLHAYYVSGIADGAGRTITGNAWTGYNFQHLHRATAWPQQGVPSRRDWDTWRRYIKVCLLGRGMTLKTPLGKWNTPVSDWSWFFSPSEESLYYKKDESWIRFSRTPV
jgi:hypothetical protein